MVKHIESGRQTQNIKQSVTQLLDRAPPGPLRAELEAEFTALNTIGNNFIIRHHGGQQQTLPTDAAVDYVFVRLASVIALRSAADRPLGLTAAAGLALRADQSEGPGAVRSASSGCGQLVRQDRVLLLVPASPIA
jgi:hypothetical protein